MNDVQPTTCTQCGTSLTSGSQEGLCARCLLSAAVRNETLAPIDPISKSNLPPTGNVASGNQIGPIRLTKQIGRGGMGEVWLGWHEFLGRNVAVKFLMRQAMDRKDPAFTTFMQGARVAAAIEHPGLNKIHNADVNAGVPYLVLELLDGPNLGDLVERSGPLDLPTARAVLEAVGEAVAELNQKNLVHRDIKPSNIVLTTDGRVVLTDFGLACARPATNADGGKAVAGTPAYMAPEMFDGVISTRTDVYALGMTAYHLLSGRPALSGNLEEQRRQHRDCALDIEPLCAAKVPQGVIDVVVRATTKDALYRPKTAWQILLSFRAAFDEAGIKRASANDLANTLKARMGAADVPAQNAPPASRAGGVSQIVSELVTRKRDSRSAMKAVAPLALPLPPLPPSAEEKSPIAPSAPSAATNAAPAAHQTPQTMTQCSPQPPTTVPAAAPTQLCGKCHYCITGLSTNICPECGSDLRKVGTATRLPRSYWRLAAYATVWAVIAYVITLLAFANLHRFVPYTYQLHLQRSIFPYRPNGSCIINVDKYANQTRWGEHWDYVPPITEMTLFYSGSAKPFGAMHINLRTGGYNFVDGAGKAVVANSGFDVNVLSRWLATGGWNASDPVDRTLIDSIMTCITETSLAQSTQKNWTTLPIEGTLFRVEATRTQNLAPFLMNAETHAVSYGYPPNWVRQVQQTRMIFRSWAILWVVGVAWLVRRKRWRVTKWPPTSDILPLSG